MSETKHTPGPWKIFYHDGAPLPDSSGHYDGYLKTEIRTGKGHSIYIRQSVAGKAFPELGANARLIAAAPRMKAVIEEGIEAVDASAEALPPGYALPKCLAEWVEWAEDALRQIEGRE